MEKEYRKLYYRLLLIPPALFTRRKRFKPVRWICPFARTHDKRDQERLDDIFTRLYPRAFLQQQILVVYRDETLSER